MEKDKEKKDISVFPRSVKIPTEFYQELKDWLSAKDKDFSPLVIELLREHIKKNPLTPTQKKWLTEKNKG
jgi:hypothetical protein